MALIAACPIDPERLVQTLEAAHERLDGADRELVLDFSSVRRLDTHALTALAKLADAAGRDRARVACRGVSVEVYKVLKLVKLASRFTFLN
jgi:anti-anti-sigma regulatory factor